jgi:hypothetical protein
MDTFGPKLKITCSRRRIHRKTLKKECLIGRS